MQTCERFDQTISRDNSNHIVKTGINHAVFEFSRTINFQEFVWKVQIIFENFEWQKMNLTKWHTIIFNDVIVQNFTLFTNECLKKLCIKIDMIYRKFESTFQYSIHHRKTIIKTCRIRLTNAIDLTNSAENTSNFINNMHFFLINYETMHKSF